LIRHNGLVNTWGASSAAWRLVSWASIIVVQGGWTERPNRARPWPPHASPHRTGSLLVSNGLPRHQCPPSRPFLVPIERIAPGSPEDDNLIQEVSLFLGGLPKLIPCDEPIPNGTADERGRPCRLHIALLIGYINNLKRSPVGCLPGEVTGAADVSMQILFKSIEDLICLHRISLCGITPPVRIDPRRRQTNASFLFCYAALE
jgi:hypothetical protein